MTYGSPAPHLNDCMHDLGWCAVAGVGFFLACFIVFGAGWYFGLFG